MLRRLCTSRTPSVLVTRLPASSLAVGVPALPIRLTTPFSARTWMSSPSVLLFHSSLDFTVAVSVASSKRWASVFSVTSLACSSMTGGARSGSICSLLSTSRTPSMLPASSLASSCSAVFSTAPLKVATPSSTDTWISNGSRCRLSANAVSMAPCWRASLNCRDRSPSAACTSGARVIRPAMAMANVDCLNSM